MNSREELLVIILKIICCFLTCSLRGLWRVELVIRRIVYFGIIF